MFTWIPLYQEIARKLLEFENRQDELLALLRGFAERGFRLVRWRMRTRRGTASR